jgi:hypothetical protein
VNFLVRRDMLIGQVLYAWRCHWTHILQKTVQLIFVCIICYWVAARCKTWDVLRGWLVAFFQGWNCSWSGSLPSHQWNNFIGYFKDLRFNERSNDGSLAMFFSRTVG